ncbi:hypothetical protein DFH09DRAFT_1328650 [Mycena vulgaris]|nr:hypothetical protein DFH09DRAFT_1328650 [Mycena vulgaris]
MENLRIPSARAAVIVALCICAEQTFSQEFAREETFAAAFPRAFHAYLLSTIKSQVEDATATLPLQDSGICPPSNVYAAADVARSPFPPRFSINPVAFASANPAPCSLNPAPLPRQYRLSTAACRFVACRLNIPALDSDLIGSSALHHLSFLHHAPLTPTDAHAHPTPLNLNCPPCTTPLPRLLAPSSPCSSAVLPSPTLSKFPGHRDFPSVHSIYHHREGFVLLPVDEFLADTPLFLAHPALSHRSCPQAHDPSPALSYSIPCPITNIVSYLHTIHKILAPGGVWINLGPLLWHWGNNTTNHPRAQDWAPHFHFPNYTPEVRADLPARQDERTIDTTYRGCVGMRPFIGWTNLFCSNGGKCP